MNMKRTILDVSRYQGNIDWDAVKAEEIDGVILKTVSTNRKMSHRQDGLYVDPMFDRNYLECRRVGLPVGAYYYTYALDKDMMDAELSLLKEKLTGKVMEMPIVVDVEDNKICQLSREKLTDLTAYACQQIENWGMYAMIYTYTAYASAAMYMDGAILAPYDKWLADYTGRKPNVTWKYSMHQYTSKGHIPGIVGNVDLSRTNRDYPEIIRRKGLSMVREGK